MPADLQVLEASLGRPFANRELLIRALTHKSACFEKKTPEDLAFIDNEQFEFLGDSILGFVISECLVCRYPSYPEGRLSKMKAQLVSSEHLHRVAQAMDLGSFLHLGRGEEMSGGRGKRALLANALEAIIAAIYLDAGIEVTREFIVRKMVDQWNLADSSEEDRISDYKTALQERAQALGLPQPRYIIAKENGPEHSKTFIVEVRVGPTFSGRGEGPSKKSAGQSAAKSVLEKMK